MKKKDLILIFKFILIKTLGDNIKKRTTITIVIFEKMNEKILTTFAQNITPPSKNHVLSLELKSYCCNNRPWKPSGFPLL